MTGVSPPYAECDGTYNLTSIQHNDSPVYGKLDRVLAKYEDDKWGCALSSSNWLPVNNYIKSKYRCKKVYNTY